MKNITDYDENDLPELEFDEDNNFHDLDFDKEEDYNYYNEVDTTKNLKCRFDYKNIKGYDFVVEASCKKFDGYYAKNLKIKITHEGKELYAIHRKDNEEITEMVFEDFYAQAYEGADSSDES